MTWMWPRRSLRVEGLSEFREAMRNLTPEQTERMRSVNRQLALNTVENMHIGVAAYRLIAEIEAYLRGEPGQ